MFYVKMTNQAIATLNGNYLVNCDFGIFYLDGQNPLNILRVSDSSEWSWAVESWGKIPTSLPFKTVDEEILKPIFEQMWEERLSYEDDYEDYDYEEPCYTIIMEDIYSSMKNVTVRENLPIEFSRTDALNNLLDCYEQAHGYRNEDNDQHVETRYSLGLENHNVEIFTDLEYDKLFLLKRRFPHMKVVDCGRQNLHTVPSSEETVANVTVHEDGTWVYYEEFEQKFLYSILIPDSREEWKENTRLVYANRYNEFLIGTSQEMSNQEFFKFYLEFKEFIGY